MQNQLQCVVFFEVSSRRAAKNHFCRKWCGISAMHVWFWISSRKHMIRFPPDQTDTASQRSGCSFDALNYQMILHTPCGIWSDSKAGYPKTQTPKVPIFRFPKPWSNAFRCLRNSPGAKFEYYWNLYLPLRWMCARPAGECDEQVQRWKSISQRIIK